MGVEISDKMVLLKALARLMFISRIVNLRIEYIFDFGGGLIVMEMDYFTTIKIMIYLSIRVSGQNKIMSLPC